MTDRAIWHVTGADALTFLQGLVSNDVLRLKQQSGLVWAALLTPQGKYLADFFVVHLPDGRLLIDIAAPLAEATLRRLTMYRLRADVQITPTELTVARGLTDAPAGALPDPRHPALGWRAYGPNAGAGQPVDWDAIRVDHIIPESGVELIPDDSYILEAGFERLHGVDFRKGCYVGQEVTARMKHKTELRKGLVRVCLSAPVPQGSAVTDAQGREIGRVFTQSGGRAIAHLRLDRSDGPMTAAGASVTLD